MSTKTQKNVFTRKNESKFEKQERTISHPESPLFHTEIPHITSNLKIIKSTPEIDGALHISEERVPLCMIN